MSLGSSTLSIEIINDGKIVNIPDKYNVVKAVLKSLDITHNCSICIKYVSLLEMKKINQEYKKKNKPTNVLSFQGYTYSQEKGEEMEHLGDLVLCPDYIDKEARINHLDIDKHWVHMIVHGVLHLLGYDHEFEPEALTMEAKEINILSKLGYSNPYIH